MEYLDPCRVHIRAVIKSDGVAHLMPQQGTPLLCYTVGYLSASKEKHAESEAILFQTMSRGMTLLKDLQRQQLRAEAASRQSLSLLLPTQPPGGTEKIKMWEKTEMRPWLL